MLYAIKSGGLLALVGLVAILTLAAIACGGAAPAPTSTPLLVVATPIPTPKEKIIFADLNWDSAQLQNAAVRYIVEHGYGYPTDAIFGATIPLWEGLLKGDIHVNMEVWLPNQQEAWDKAIAESAVTGVGRTLDDNWQSAFVVPTYVVEENPGLRSVQDLRKFKDLFVTADSKGKARLVNCPAGWECEKDTAQQVEAYGLQDVIELVNPGSDAALFASLEGAYQKRAPWLGFIWAPTKTAGALDLTLLEEPTCEADAKPESGCAYPAARVTIAVHPGLEQRAPEVIEFLQKWNLTAADEGAAEVYMGDNNATFEEAAIWLLKNDDVWTTWMPADNAKKVKEALAAEG